MPISLFLVVPAGVSTRLSARFGIKLTVGVGILLAATARLYFSQVIAVDSSYGTILAGFLLLGTGMGTAMTPATDSIMGSVPAAKAEVGSAMNDTAGEAFVLGMTQAMFIASLIMLAAAVVTFAILPARIQRADKIVKEVSGVETAPAPETTTAPLPAPGAAAAD